MGTNTPAIDVLAPKALKERLGVKHCPFLHKLLVQERFSHGNNFEKLGLPKSSLIVYSLRLNHKERVLLTKHELGGQYYWLILDYLEHHEYDKSPFLKPGHLKQYLSLEKNVKGLVSLGKKESTTAASAAPQAIASTTTLTAASPTTAAAPAVEVEPTIHKELHPFNNELIVLNADQEKALALSEPMLLTGMPGSGKSAVAVTYLTQCLNPQLEATAAAPAPPPLLYVAESASLVKQMKASFDNSPLGQTAMARQLLFSSYDDLLLREYPALKDLKRVYKTDFYTWFNGLQRQELATLKTKLGSKTAELVYQELRMMSGMSVSEYEATGGRASPLWSGDSLPKIAAKKKGAKAGSATALSDAEQQQKLREAIYELKKEYCSHLTTNKRYDSSFFALPLQSKAHYSHIAVDEAQDFSTLQLRTLHTLALPASKGPAIAYFADSHQSVEDNFPKHHFFKTILKIAHIGELPLTYRCSKAVLDFANNLLGMQYHVTGGQMDKGGQAFISTSEQMASGGIYCHPENAAHQSAAMQSHLAALTNTTQCAVITAEGLIEEVQTRFPGAIVLTPQQAKGLEYDDIILYRLFEHSYYKKISQLLADYEGCDMSAAVHRAKAGTANYEYTALLNGVFTAITRARKHLFLLLPQDKKKLHDIEHMVNALRLALSQNAPAPQATAVPVATKEDWVAQIDLQLEKGNVDAAAYLAKKHLGLSIEQFKQQFRNDQKEKKDMKEIYEYSRDRKEDIGFSKDEKSPSKVMISRGNQHNTKLPAALQKPNTALVVAKESQPVEKAVPLYMTLRMLDILDAPPEKTFKPLLKLLQQKNFFEQLFNTHAGTGLSLFEKISDEKKALVSQVLKPLIKNNATVAKGITLEGLCRNRKDGMPGSPLLALSQSEQGIVLLDSILSTYFKEWLKTPSFPLFLQALYEPLTNEEAGFKNHSALSSLSAIKAGQKLLNTYISSYMDVFVTKEFVAALFLPDRVKKTKKNLNLSAFSYLNRFDDTAKLLDNIITRYPNLFTTKEFISTLFHPHGVEGPFTNTLSTFCYSPEGRAMLDKLITIDPPQFLNKEFMTALCHTPSQPDKLTHFSGLYYLCEEVDGRVWLAKTMTNNMNLFATKELVMALCTPHAGLDMAINTTPLYWLCSCCDGIDILRKLWIANPSLLATEAFVEALCLLRPKGNVNNNNALFLLCTEVSGLQLIGGLHSTNPSLFTTPKVATTLCITVTADTGEIISALSILCSSTYGRLLLDLLIDNNPHLCTTETFISALKLKFPYGAVQNESPLSLLHKSEDGFALLVKMGLQNPALRAEIDFSKQKVAPLAGGAAASVKQTQQPRFFSVEVVSASSTATAAANTASLS